MWMRFFGSPERSRVILVLAGLVKAVCLYVAMVSPQRLALALGAPNATVHLATSLGLFFAASQFYTTALADNLAHAHEYGGGHSSLSWTKSAWRRCLPKTHLDWSFTAVALGSFLPPVIGLEGTKTELVAAFFATLTAMAAMLSANSLPARPRQAPPAQESAMEVIRQLAHPSMAGLGPLLGTHFMAQVAITCLVATLPLHMRHLGIRKMEGKHHIAIK